MSPDLPVTVSLVDPEPEMSHDTHLDRIRKFPARTCSREPSARCAQGQGAAGTQWQADRARVDAFIPAPSSFSAFSRQRQAVVRKAVPLPPCAAYSSNCRRARSTRARPFSTPRAANCWKKPAMSRATGSTSGSCIPALATRTSGSRFLPRAGCIMLREKQLDHNEFLEVLELTPARRPGPPSGVVRSPTPRRSPALFWLGSSGR